MCIITLYFILKFLTLIDVHILHHIYHYVFTLLPDQSETYRKYPHVIVGQIHIYLS